MKVLRLITLGILALVLLQNPTSAAPGDLDPTFGSGGKLVLSNFGDILNPQLAIQADSNKYVIAATLTNPGGSLVWLMRLNRNGSFDSSFNGSYNYLTNAANIRLPTQVLDVAISPSGKILVLSVSSTPTLFCITQFNANGTKDMTFGAGGERFITGLTYPKVMAITPSGKIVVGGQIYNHGTTYRDFGVAQFTQSGAIDNTFDGDGIKAISFYSCQICSIMGSTGDDLTDVKIQPGDGKIILAGIVQDIDFSRELGVARLLVNGDLDNSFDLDGKVETISETYNPPRNSSSIVVQDDGSLVFQSSRGSSSQLTRFSSAGNIIGFEPNRGFYLGCGPNGEIAKQSDNKIVEAIELCSNTRPNFGVMRHNSDLSRDISWLPSGNFVSIDFSSPLLSEAARDIPTDMVIDSLNKPLIVGESVQGNLVGTVYTIRSKLAIVRLLPN